MMIYNTYAFLGVCFVITLIYAFLSIKIVRTKKSTQLTVATWAIIILVAIMQYRGVSFARIVENIGYLNNGGSLSINLGLFIIEFILLSVINIRTINNKVLAVIYAFTQCVLSIFIIPAIIITIALFFVAGGNSKVIPTTSHQYTDEENQYAKANGFYDAQSANEKGFDTSEANNPGFDYTQKRF